MDTKAHPRKKERPLLECRSLTVGYRQARKNLAVAGPLNFSLYPGELVGIVGVNGIGKSTLLRSLAGMQRCLSGDILLKGNPIRSLSSHSLAAQLSIVLTDPIATKNFRVQELVALGRHPYTNWLGLLTEADQQAIRTAIRTTGIVELQNKKCYELSDGQLQKVLIARALAQDTGIMLLDEPTTHLDLYHKTQVFQLLRTIAHQQRRCIVFTTHEIELAIQLCDRMLLLDAGDNPMGDPCQLISDKRFESLFPKDSIRFDPETGTFRVQKSVSRNKN